MATVNTAISASTSIKPATVWFFSHLKYGIPLTVILDSLLVSLGLETDVKSFQTANDAVKRIKDVIMPLAAAAGIGAGLKAPSENDEACWLYTRWIFELKPFNTF